MREEIRFVIGINCFSRFVGCHVYDRHAIEHAIGVVHPGRVLMKTGEATALLLPSPVQQKTDRSRRVHDRPVGAQPAAGPRAVSADQHRPQPGRAPARDVVLGIVADHPPPAGQRQTAPLGGQLEDPDSSAASASPKRFLTSRKNWSRGTAPCLSAATSQPAAWPPSCRSPANSAAHAENASRRSTSVPSRSNNASRCTDAPLPQPAVHFSSLALMSTMCTGESRPLVTSRENGCPCPESPAVFSCAVQPVRRVPARRAPSSLRCPATSRVARVMARRRAASLRATGWETASATVVCRCGRTRGRAGARPSPGPVAGSAPDRSDAPRRPHAPRAGPRRHRARARARPAPVRHGTAGGTGTGGVRRRGTDGLQMAVGPGADPHVPPGGRYGTTRMSARIAHTPGEPPSDAAFVGPAAADRPRRAEPAPPVAGRGPRVAGRGPRAASPRQPRSPARAPGHLCLPLPPKDRLGHRGPGRARVTARFTSAFRAP